MESDEKRLKQANDKWEKQHKAEFEQDKKKDYRTASGIPIKRLYTPLDLKGQNIDFFADVGFPGEYPYTRGIDAVGYRGHPWIQRQNVGRATAEECNTLAKALIASGVDDIQIVFDLPSQLGYDPDHPLAEGEVGKIGWSMSSLRDWEVGFEGIDLSKVRLCLAMNATAAVTIAFYLALAEKRGVDFAKLWSVFQNDILKEYLVRGLYIFPPRPAMRLFVDATAYCQKVGAKRVYPLQPCGYQFGERGATPAHEVGCTLAMLFTYIQAFADRGLDLDNLLENLEYNSPVYHFGFFEQIAKNRALRKIYAKVLKERFGVKNPEALKLRLYASCGGTGLTREQYINNIARVALDGTIGCLSGAQTVRLTAYDEAIGIASLEALKTALRAQQIIAYETDMPNVIDPLGGSYFVEWLTSKMETEILKVVKQIDDMGGVVKCVEEGSLELMLTQDAYEQQIAFEKGDLIRVGVNFLRDEGAEPPPPKVYRPESGVEEVRKKDVRELRKNRDNSAVQKALLSLKKLAAKEAAGDENNVMPAIMDAVRAYATSEEICGVLREVWGEYRQPNVFR